jgi:hypothetical protein
MSSEPTAPMAEEQAREIVNRWADGGVFRLRNMGDKIFVESITAGAAYTLRLQTHYEQRRTRQATRPYRGESVDDRGRPPDKWELAVPRPRPFEERSDTLQVPHTERVEMCGTCSGQGRVTCTVCFGQGRMACPRCGGLGFIEEQILDPSRPGQGSAGPSIRTVRRGCACNGGQVVCSGCSGAGIVRCGGCAGSGQVKTFQQVVVRFLTAKQGEVIDVTPVPDKWLGTLTGEVLADENSPLIRGTSGLPEHVARKAQELLDKSHEVDQQDDRILLQTLHVERIPLQEMRYKYAGVERHLWICGAEQAVYAPNAPWNRGRLLALIAGCAGAVVLIVGLVVFLLALR